MSAICGVLHRSGKPVERVAIEQMVGALSHWGPDAVGVWTDGPVGLGHAMLRNTPESQHERQPFVGPDRLIVTADARIDNRDDLFEALRTTPGARTMPDSTLIAHAYMKWGTRCPEFLVGDFAFALWDARRECLFCARDYIGVKPFYYFQAPDRFLFATEIKGIFSHSDVPRALREQALAEFLLRVRGDAHESIYEDVRLLPAAHSLVVRRDTSELRRYWSPDPNREIRFSRDDDYVEAFQERLSLAVESRVRTRYPIASTLSEGIDSATVTWLARRSAASSHSQVVALSWADRPEPNRENRYADPFLAAAPMRHEYVALDPGRVFRPSSDLFRFHDGPIRDRRFAEMLDTFEAAARHGARVILFGIGGDEVATSPGPDHLLGLLLRGRIGPLLGEMRAQARVCGGSMPGIIRRELMEPLLRSAPGRLRLSYTRSGAPLASERTAGTSEFLGRYRGLERGGATDLPEGLARKNPVRANQFALAFQGRLQHAMETRYSVASLFRMECRFPMLDRRLVEFCLALPPEQHRKDGWARRLVRRAMDGDLPHALIWNPRKQGAVAVDGWSHYRNGEGSIRTRLAKWGSCEGVARYVDLSKVEGLLDACLAGDAVATGHLERGFLLAAYLARVGSVGAGVDICCDLV